MFYLFNMISTIIICLQGSMSYDNVSTIGYNTDLKYFVISYIIISAIGFSLKMLKIYNIFPNKIYKICIILTGIVMSVSALFPYAYNGEDLFSQIHVHCSMIGCLSFLVLLFIYTRLLSLYHNEIYEKLHLYFDLGIQILCLSFMFFSRVNGYVEIIYSILVCTYMIMIERELNKD